MKTCKECHQEKDLTEFYKNKNSTDGFNSKCKVCRSKIDKIYSKKFRQTHREERNNVNKEFMRKFRRQNIQKNMFNQAKCRAKKNDLEFNLEANDIILTETCPVFGMKFNIGDGKQQDDSPTLDRIDNTKGYIKGNVIVVSWKANNLKRNATMDDLQKIVDFYRSIK